MTGTLIRVIVILVIAFAIWFGVRRIWRDWTSQFRAVDEAKRQRDLEERQRPDVIDLKRGADGTYRPKDEER